MSRKYFEPTPEMNQLLTQAGSMNREESLAATRELAKALHGAAPYAVVGLVTDPIDLLCDGLRLCSPPRARA